MYSKESRGNDTYRKSKATGIEGSPGSNKNGFLYKTHSIRNKFSNPIVVIQNPAKIEQESSLGDDNTLKGTIESKTHYNNNNFTNFENNFNTFPQNVTSTPLMNQTLPPPINYRINQFNIHKNINPYQTAGTIYNVLNKTKNEFMSNIIKKKLEQQTNEGGKIGK